MLRMSKPFLFLICTAASTLLPATASTQVSGGGTSEELIVVPSGPRIDGFASGRLVSETKQFFCKGRRIGIQLDYVTPLPERVHFRSVIRSVSIDGRKVRRKAIEELNGLIDTFPNPRVGVYCPKDEVTVHLYQHDRELVRSLYVPVDR